MPTKWETISSHWRRHSANFRSRREARTLDTVLPNTSDRDSELWRHWPLQRVLALVIFNFDWTVLADKTTVVWREHSTLETRTKTTKLHSPRATSSFTSPLRHAHHVLPHVIYPCVLSDNRMLSLIVVFFSGCCDGGTKLEVSTAKQDRLLHDGGGGKWRKTPDWPSRSLQTSVSVSLKSLSYPLRVVCV